MITSIIISSIISGRYASKKKCNENQVRVATILFNLASSLALVFLNKWLYLNLCQILKLFTVKLVPLAAIFPLALAFCGFVVLTNLSLEHNTVGTFQVAKVLTTPCVLFIQWQFYKTHPSRKILLTTVPILGGVFLAFYYDLKFNVTGSVFASLGVLVTSIYQVLVGEKQAELQVNSMQLLYFQAPLSAVILFFGVVLLEPLDQIMEHSWTTVELVAVLLSCLIAFGVNVSIYWIIGNTSALSYNMVGHLKFCLTVFGGILLFGDPVTLNQIVGILLTLLGVIFYTHLKVKEDDERKRTNTKLVQTC